MIFIFFSSQLWSDRGGPWTERPLEEAKVQITQHLGQGGEAAAGGRGAVWLARRGLVHTCSVVRGPGGRGMQGASASLAFTESDLSGIQTKSGIKKKNHQNAQKFLSEILSSGSHQRMRENSWVVSPDPKWPRFSVSEECSQEGISQLLGQA